MDQQRDDRQMNGQTNEWGNSIAMDEWMDGQTQLDGWMDGGLVDGGWVGGATTTHGLPVASLVPRNPHLLCK